MSKLALNIIYAIFCTLFIYIMSYLEEEYYTNGRDIKDICDTYRALLDDTRELFSPTCLLVISPLIYATVKKRFKSLPLNIMTFALLAYWIWQFFIRLMICI
ncbi:Inner membrane protein YjeO [Photorhabdus australis subsp. thailandensis]|uniref:Inner membrane protein YjeO n=1 Tax=Photorhabdus australis subsp. thailandensis TaxID=2805096 RepID=A0A1C0U9U7_9GAMM|nr:YjeO family protein [Photorhabdus australis]OCQ54694.1 Inner membrane protein YjeO [Photorhabdus australis subsp. thailandensis]